MLMFAQNVTFIGAHDSAFVDDKEMLAANQHFNVTQQLDDGIRLLQSQGHKPPTAITGVIELCHTRCDMFSPPVFELILDWTLGRYQHTWQLSKGGLITTLVKVFSPLRYLLTTSGYDFIYQSRQHRHKYLGSELSERRISEHGLRSFVQLNSR